MTGSRDGKTEARLQGEFSAEAQELVEALSRTLLDADAAIKQGRAPLAETVNEAFRAIHTLKGLSSLFGRQDLSELSHVMEEALDGVRLGRIEFEVSVLDRFFETVDLLVRASGGEPPSRQELQEGLMRLKALMVPSQPAHVMTDALEQLSLGPELLSSLTEYEEHRLRSSLERGSRLYLVHGSFDLSSIDEELEQLRDKLKAFGEVITCLPSDEPAGEDRIGLDLMLATEAPRGEVMELVAGLGKKAEELGRPGTLTPIPQDEASGPSNGILGRSHGGFGPPEPPVDAGPLVGSIAPGDKTPVPSGRAAGLVARETAREGTTVLGQTVRVDIGRLDRLMNTVGELALVRNELRDLGRALSAGEAGPDLARLMSRQMRAFSRRLDELQRGILEVRMVPLSQVFDRLARVVRRLSRESDKQVGLYVSGGDTEIDKLIVEELSDPLMHILRNCIDHGVEDPITRTALGKPPEGMVALRAFPRGNHVVLEVEDDGAGIDPDLLLHQAIRRGFVTPEQGSEMGRRELLNLIFLPGFTTKEEAGPLSGRGVGMDVVKTNLSRLSGLIDIFSKPGQGTRFTLTLPITLAIIRALLVRVSDQIYAIPLSTVLEIFPIRPGQVTKLEGREVVSLRGVTLPLMRLEPVFGLASRAIPAMESEGREYVVVVGMAQHRVGIVVNLLVGQQDIVIKSLGKSLSGVPGIAGATELGGRRTVLVLDVAPLVEEVTAG
ncbi:MAG: chemotaxis protein CheA [Polyangia bacterium]|jgi:two-component system chemotaxis sensor kinase CheA|nr:chemotaxis protein CheA [Polyangia bacterium]